MFKMKKLLFALAVLFCSNLYAQEVTGCLGNNFGDNLATVKANMASKPGFKFNSETAYGVSYINGYYGKYECLGIALQLHKNQLHTIKVLVYVKNPPRVMDMYYEIVDELQIKYGIQPEYLHEYRYPYQANDGHTPTAIKLGYADIACIFKFPNNRVITVDISETLTIKVAYQDSNLAREAIEESKKNNQKDY